MSIREITGLWYTDEKYKHQGVLVRNPDKGEIRLEIYSDKYIEGVSVEPIHNSGKHYHEIILNDKAYITLYNCKWSGVESVGTSLSRITYSVEFVIYGKVKINTVKIKSGTFIINRFSGWYDGNGVNDKIKGKSGLYMDGKEVRQKDIREDKIVVNDNLTIYAIDEVIESTVEFSTQYSTEYFKYVTFHYENEVNFEQLLKDSLVLQKLLAVAYNKSDLYKKLLNVIAKSDSIEGEYTHIDKHKYVKLSINNYSLHKNMKFSHGVEPAYHTLFSYSNCEREKLNELIINWYKNQDSYNHIYEYYIDSNRWFKQEGALISNVMFNNRFLNMVQALEDYHRNHIAQNSDKDNEIFKEKRSKALAFIKDAELKQWVNNNLVNKQKKEYTLKQRLSEIIDYCKNIAGSIFANSNLDKFPDSASHYRSLLSHGLSKKISHGKELIDLFHVSQVLLAVCILKSLDMNDIDINISNYDGFRRKVAGAAYFKKKNAE